RARGRWRVVAARRASIREPFQGSVWRRATHYPHAYREARLRPGAGAAGDGPAARAHLGRAAAARGWGHTAGAVRTARARRPGWVALPPRRPRRLAAVDRFARGGGDRHARTALAPPARQCPTRLWRRDRAGAWWRSVGHRRGWPRRLPGRARVAAA